MIHADMVQVNKSKEKPDRFNQGLIKHLTRTSGVKGSSKDNVVDLTGLAEEATISLAAAIGTAREQTLTSADETVKTLCRT